MTNKIKLIALSLLLLPVTMLASAQRKTVAPTVKSPTSFVIVIDEQSYAKLPAQVEAYRRAIENDGLAAWIVADRWQSPEQVKSLLVKMASDKKMPIEGAVFVGDIPIAMLRDAQHLSSAFKMDQNRDWKESSIPSDRFYDDFDLTFDFIRQDEEKPEFFYYSLRSDSPQYVNQDIYTGRIRPFGEDKYAQLAKYLDKVVAAHAEANPLDNLLVFRGHGYNSEAKEAWSGEQISLREQLPTLFTTGNTVRFYDFETRFPMKPYLLEHLRNPELDVALCHHHGSEEMQYLNGYQTVSGAQASAENIKRFLRSKVVGSKDPEGNLKKYMEYMDVPASWIDTSDSMRLADEAYNRSLDIYAEDIYAAAPNVRFIMFDACYNGSFHVGDCISNAYLFSDGKTVVTQGNTVNSLQDKHPDAFVGLLASGLRIGQWGRHAQQFIESHIVGDPTYRFANTATPALDINRAIAVEGKNDKFWLEALSFDSADWQAMAVRKLATNNYPGIERLLMDTYLSSPYGGVRLECVKMLARKDSPLFLEMLALGMNDSYELVRRLCTEYIGKCGNDELLPVLVKALIEDNLSNRVNYHARSNLTFFSPDKARAEVEKQLAAHTQLMNPDADAKSLCGVIESGDNRVKGNMEELLGSESTPRERKFALTTLRNYHYHYIVPEVIRFAEDTTQPLDLRVTAVEALGWFHSSYQKEAINAMCDRLVASGAPEALVAEARKTRSRLKPF